MSTLIMMLPLFAIILILPLVAGIYVYRDAKQRNMNAVMWTLLAILAPFFLGFIIYLLERVNYSNMKCPKCDMVIKEDYVMCPKCGTKLRAACPNCFTPVQMDWAFCAKCAYPLPESQNDIVSPIRKKDKTLGKVLLLIFLIPAVLLIMLIISFISFPSSSVKTIATATIDEYLQEHDHPDIREWIEESGKEYNKAYVLQYETISDKQIEIDYIIYAPWCSEESSISSGSDSGLFGPVLKVEMSDIGGNRGNMLILVHYIGNKKPRLKVYQNGSRAECEITKAEHSF